MYGEGPLARLFAVYSCPQLAHSLCTGFPPHFHSLIPNALAVMLVD